MPILPGAFLLGVLAASPTPPPPVDRTALPVWTEQIRTRESWLAERHARLLEMMRRHGVAMWVVVNEEFHDDPLTALVAPPRPYVGNRDIFVFVDAGKDGLKRHAVSGFFEEALTRFFETPRDPKPPPEALAELYKRYQPKTIALSIDGRRGVTRPLHDFLAPRGEPIALRQYCDTRLPARCTGRWCRSPPAHPPAPLSIIRQDSHGG
jgi:hypothetical protein